MTTEQRLDVLERANRMWRTLAVFLCLVIVCGLLLAGTASTRSSDIIEAKGLRILDRKGQLRLEIRGTDQVGEFGQAGLRLYGRDGKLRVTLVALGEGGLAFFDENEVG